MPLSLNIPTYRALGESPVRIVPKTAPRTPELLSKHQKVIHTPL